MAILSGQYADVNGVRLHFASSGEKGKPLMMFVHGFPEFWYEWRRQLEEFGAGCFAAAPDMRGYNLSSKPEAVEQYRIKHVVEDLRALAEHLGYGRFTLVGHDWGGAAAWAFAIEHPGWLERLAIVNAPHPAIFARELANNPAQQKASAYMLTFRSPEAERILSAGNYAALVRTVMGDGLKAGAFTSEDREKYIEAWSRPGALTGGLNFYRAARVGQPSSEGERSMTVRVPTLVVWGERDTALLTGNLDGLGEYVPDLTLKRIPDGSHWVVHEKPEEVNGYLCDFLGAAN